MAFTDIKHPLKRAFLSAYAITGSVRFASAEAKVGRELHYSWKAHDLEYAAAFDEARIMAAEVLTDEAKRRAHKGTRELVLYQGAPVMFNGKPLYRTKYSDSLLQFLIENLDKQFVPKREIAHSTPEPIKIEHTRRLDLSHLTEEELSTLERIGERVRNPTGVGTAGTPTPERTED